MADEPEREVTVDVETVVTAVDPAWVTVDCTPPCETATELGTVVVAS